MKIRRPSNKRRKKKNERKKERKEKKDGQKRGRRRIIILLYVQYRLKRFSTTRNRICKLSEQMRKTWKVANLGRDGEIVRFLANTRIG